MSCPSSFSFYWDRTLSSTSMLTVLLLFPPLSIILTLTLSFATPLTSAPSSSLNADAALRELYKAFCASKSTSSLKTSGGRFESGTGGNGLNYSTLLP